MSVLCQNLHQLFLDLDRYGSPLEPNRYPRNGIYLLFEKGETGHGGERIVRVGTHTGENQLRSRLVQHFENKNKDRSIFRKNIGRAILNRDHDPFLAEWNLDLTTRAARQKYAHTIDRKKLAEIEERVSAYIQENVQFCVFRVESKPARLFWEAKVISTISHCSECGPSPHWLGLYSPKAKIRESGLWLVNQLDKEPLTEQEFGRLMELVRTSRRSD